MSETRGQHHVPQFLVRGFASRVGKKGSRLIYHVWQFSKGTEPHEPNITGVFRQRDFHGDPKTSPLEDDIAKLESGFGAVINQLRGGAAVHAEHEHTIRDLGSHLTIRTRNLRDGFTSSATRMFGLVPRLIDTPGFRDVVMKDARSFMDTALRQQLGAMGAVLPPGVDVDQIFTWAMSKFADEGWAEVREQFLGMLGGFSPEAAATEAHLNSLGKEESVSSRSNMLINYKWHTVQFEPHSLILGDVGVLARDSSGVLGNPLMVQPNMVEILLPIAHDLLFVGSPRSAKTTWADEVNQASASLSRYSFVANRCTDRERFYQENLLATRSEFLGDQELKRMLNDALANLKRRATSLGGS